MNSLVASYMSSYCVAFECDIASVKPVLHLIHTYVANIMYMRSYLAYVRTSFIGNSLL